MRAALLGLLSMCLFMLVGCNQKTEEKEHFIGYLGRAKQNPYLVAQRYLESSGHEVVSSTGVLKFDQDESVVFSPASSIRSVAEAQRILDWAAAGGHFVCFLERGEDYWQDVGEWADHTPERWSEDVDEEDEVGLDVLLAAQGLRLVENEQKKTSWKQRGGAASKGEKLPNAEDVLVRVADDFSLQAKLGGTRLLVSAHEGNAGDDVWADAGEKHHFYSSSRGVGRITFLTDARAFRNPYLKFSEHAELLDLLVSCSDNEGGKVVFSLGKVRSFTSMLGEYAPMAMWSLLVLTVVWLWKNVPRFGPLLDVQEEDSRSYAQVVLNTGKFYWRYKREDVLLKCLRDAVIRKAGHAHQPEFDSEALIDALSSASKIHPDEVRNALFRSEARDAHSMVKISKTLQQILTSL